MKKITNVESINEFIENEGSITKEQWIEKSLAYFRSMYKKDCDHLVSVFKDAYCRKDRHAYAMAYGHYREWIDANRASIMGCIKRDCGNFMKYFNLSPDCSIGRGKKMEWLSSYASSVVNQVLNYLDSSRGVVDAYNQYALPLAQAWANASYEQKKKLCGEE